MFKGPAQVDALSLRIKALEGEVEFYRRETETLKARSYGLDALIGESPAIRRLRAQIIKVAPLEIPVLIRGESGTGKELVAHAFHQLSPRRDKAMVNVNAAALPANLVESNCLVTSQERSRVRIRKVGRENLSRPMGALCSSTKSAICRSKSQAKLLRVLQDRIVERVGGDRPRSVDFRLISATNKDLQASVEVGGFRLDLYYRISPIVIELPPLRERLEDIPLLATKFLHDIAYRHARPEPLISPAALTELSERSWPGNIRQLQHEIERAFVFCDGSEVRPDDLSEMPRRVSSPNTAPQRLQGSQPRELKSAIAELQNEQIRDAIAACGGNKRKAAASLGISRSFLYKKLSEIGETNNS